MDSRVLLTVDTELTHRHFARGCTWQENFARSYEAAGVGIPYQLEVLAAHKLKACFFVDPMPALVYGLEPVKRMVAPILAAGQEVQLHLHSFWKGLAEGVEPLFELTNLDGEGQRHLLDQARSLLIEAGAPSPIAFRSGSYAVNEATLDALAELGLRYDSSHNGCEHPWPSALALPSAQIAPTEHRGIIEIPVSQIEDAGGRLRHLQLCAISTSEFRQALRHAADNRHPTVTIVSHSFELASRDGLNANALLRRRFESLCGFLAEQRERLPTMHFADLDALPLDRSASPLPPQPLRRAGRMVEQLCSNLLYERRL